ncbi:hypothetical protein [Varunaivibrio sulfuroxidans]|uniref:Uncharacterized protein n=1 Tax=Varunaivibrio sulfuroxidans TaxID=1773489 RepID=A0A4R3J9L9_9PROT|nr:hypothetical protein [Varunaivibrio sulfuroxidans]TCS62568.1 hypothetical protein EDD55_105114 [Varunaivibrio sulfuroxidans]WES30763.1 hypothetical protein P3M64_14200 [Varunaivibrio sulfuroxidans]
MTASDPAHHRAACARHVRRRARQRGVVIRGDGIVRLEAAIERLRPAFETPDRHRFWLTVKRPGRRMRVLYDTRLHCLVTVWRLRNGGL